MTNHIIGELSPTGVLDVGLRCMHSCNFCYYSYLDGSDDQFQGLRKYPFRPKNELIRIIDNIADWGLTRFDVTGGEPTLYKGLVDILDYAHNEKGLTSRITTLGQYLWRPMFKAKQPLINSLYDVGVREILFSLHAVEESKFRKITGSSLDYILKSMDMAAELGMTRMVNIVVHEHNIYDLMDIANKLAPEQLHLVNFIVMKVEFSWANNKDGAIERKARYSDLHHYLQEAISILEATGTAVNIRYGPLCAYKGMEKNLVGFKGVQLDPFEWRNGLRGGKKEGELYGEDPFLFFKTKEEYLKQHPIDVETKAGYNMCFGPQCQTCAVKHICDGVDKDYVLKYGWSEFKAYDGNLITDLSHFRYDNPNAYKMPT